MSRKPNTDSKVTRKKLVAAAIKEFSRHDYDHASLRLICGRAGLTTGALYFFFDNKEDLFRTVLDPLLSAVLQELEDHPVSSVVTVSADLNAAAETDEEVARRVVKLCMTHKAQTKMLLNNPDHPVVREFTDKVKSAVVSQILEVIGADENDEKMVAFADWLAMAQLMSVVDVIAKGLSADEAAEHLCNVTRFVRGGLPAFMEK